MSYIFIPYYSATGVVERLASHVARGVIMEGLEARLCEIPSLQKVDALEQMNDIALSLEQSLGVIMGSPTRFGHMAAPISAFWDRTASIWASGSLVGKPASVFSASNTVTGNQATLLSMLTPLLHHGMLVLGVPNEGGGGQLDSLGAPYGAYTNEQNDQADLPQWSVEQAVVIGRRVAVLAKRLNS